MWRHPQGESRAILLAAGEVHPDQDDGRPGILSSNRHGRSGIPVGWLENLREVLRDDLAQMG